MATSFGDAPLQPYRFVFVYFLLSSSFGCETSGIISCRFCCESSEMISKPHRVLVLEKAFAKYCGSYASLAGGLMLWGLEAITGDKVKKSQTN